MELGKRIALNIQRVARFSLTLGGEKLRWKVKKRKDLPFVDTHTNTHTERERERNKRPRNKSTRNVFILFRVWEDEWAGKRRCCCNFICLFLSRLHNGMKYTSLLFVLPLFVYLFNSLLRLLGSCWFVYIFASNHRLQCTCFLILPFSPCDETK